LDDHSDDPRSPWPALCKIILRLTIGSLVVVYGVGLLMSGAACTLFDVPVRFDWLWPIDWLFG
jgi:hypothetical protein